MPAIKEAKLVEKITGMICDRCGKEDYHGFGTFHCQPYTFGYESRLDTISVYFSICDNCLIEIVLKEIPDAVFREMNGTDISRKTVEDIMKKDSNHDH